MAIKIFIDQGHNYSNPNAGAEGNGLREQDVNFNIGILLAEYLQNNPNFDAITSRTYLTQILGTSVATSLAIRVQMANDWGANYFISLHCNASVNTAASFSEAFVYSMGTQANFFAEHLLIGLNNSTQIPNNGVSARQSLYVLRNTAMPATLVEMGFITNAQDAYLLGNYPQLFAQGLYNGILQYFGFSGNLQ